MGRAQGKRGELNERERRFVVAFMGKCKGNGAAAARAAGYAEKSARITASQLLTKPNVQKAIADAVAADPEVYDKEQLQRFWTAVTAAHGEHDDAELGHRLRASELLGKSQRVFVEHLEVTAAADLIELLGGKPLLK